MGAGNKKKITWRERRMDPGKPRFDAFDIYPTFHQAGFDTRSFYWRGSARDSGDTRPSQEMPDPVAIPIFMAP